MNTTPAFWWSGDGRERFWVEIRKLDGIGTSLWCPDHQTGRGGSERRNPWYELVASVLEGDIIYHYNEREQRFVGRSVAAGDANIDPDERSYSVDLKDFQPIEALVDLPYLRRKSSTLYNLRVALRAAQPGKSAYSPFQFRGTDLYGMMSNYFVKLPRNVVEEFFGQDGLAEAALPEVGDADGSTPENDGIDPGSSRRSFLRPFKPKADSDYVANVVGGRRRRSRRHESIINNCATWLEEQGYEPMRNAAVDLGLAQPPVLIEGKTINASWAPPIRQAVSQLYEYRYFKVADPGSRLIFLSETEVPKDWIRYLEQDRNIGVMWPNGPGLSPFAARRAGLEPLTTVPRSRPSGGLGGLTSPDQRVTRMNVDPALAARWRLGDTSRGMS
jgi:hypothetical protein